MSAQMYEKYQILSKNTEKKYQKVENNAWRFMFFSFLFAFLMFFVAFGDVWRLRKSDFHAQCNSLRPGAGRDNCRGEA